MSILVILGQNIRLLVILGQRGPGLGCPQPGRLSGLLPALLWVNHAAGSQGELERLPSQQANVSKAQLGALVQLF